VKINYFLIVIAEF